MDNSEVYCTICEGNHVSTLAYAWCLECDDFLCNGCHLVHVNSSATKQHEVITVKDYHNLPKFITAIKNRCLGHSEQYKFYCANHDEPICFMCRIEKHGDCKHIPPIQEITKNAKSSTAIENLEIILSKIDNAFETVKHNIKTSVLDIGRQKARFISEIESTRKCINEHLDEIEKQVVDDLSKTEQTTQAMLQKLLSDMETEWKIFDDIRQDLEKTKQYATNFQTFIGVKEMAAETDRQMKKINGNLIYDLYELKLNILTILQHFTENVNTFGIVTVQRKSFNEHLNPWIKSRVQVPTKINCHAIPKLCKTADILLPPGREQGNIQDCDILPDGKLVFVDSYNKRLIMYSSEKKYDKDINLPSVPFGVKNTDKDVVAVTLPKNREILFINVITSATIYALKVKHRCYGIDTNSQKLVVRARPTFRSSCVFFFNFEGTRVSRIYIRDWYSENISVRDETIKCSESKTNTVYCYTINGEKLWTFKDESLLRSPSGISVDKHRNVFVAGIETNNVVVLSSDGKFRSVILSEGDGLKAPCSLRIDVDRSELLVCNKYGPAFLFSLSYD